MPGPTGPGFQPMNCHPGCPRPATREYRGRWICGDHYCQAIVDTQLSGYRQEPDYEQDGQDEIDYINDGYQDRARSWEPWDPTDR